MSPDDAAPFDDTAAPDDAAAPAGVTEDEVRVLARLAALPLDPRRVPMLAAALQADLRMIGALRDVAVGDVPPASMTPP